MNQTPTKRKRTEEALLASELRYRRLFESAKDGILILDVETGMIVDVNPFLVQMLGYSHEEFLGKKVWELGFFRDIVPNYEHFQKLTLNSYVRYEDMPLKSSSGQQIDVEFISNTYLVNDQKVIQCNIRDITKRKKSEEALQESERRLSEAQKMAQLGHWVWDVKNGDIEWSEEVFNIFHLDPDTFVPNIHSVLALSPWPGDHERDEELIRKVMESHEKGSYEQRFLYPDKSIGYYHSTFQGKYDDEGNLVSIIGTVLDITERKRAQKEIHALNANLEQKVQERTAQLESINQELEAFAYSVSHDLKAPLRSVAGFSQAVLEDSAQLLPPESRDHLRRAHDEAVRMGRLIDDLLRLSRIGQQEMTVEDVDLAALALSILKSLAESEPERRVQYVLDPELHVHGDPVLMRVLLDNLLGNAWKFTSKTEEACILVRQCPSETGWFRFSISDNGAGFDPAYADRLFTPFQRLHSSEEFPGTGIGLAIVRRIVHRHGASLQAEGCPGKGATLTLTFPVSASLS